MINIPDENYKCEILPPLTFNQKTELENIDVTFCKDIDCLKCDKKYKFPNEKDEYLAHLFLEHRLVIADIDEIADLEEYLTYWHKEFKDHEFEQYCTTMLLDQLPDGSLAKNEKYYLLSDILPQDYDMRNKLQQTRLEKALERHQFERTDRKFCKECLYCRDIIKGLRAEYVEHLYNKHFLQLGKPENLVYVDELIAKVQYNLEQLVCIYCEKTFKDRITLKDHMRKKGHKRINPNNRLYDKYFLINYRNTKPKLSKSINKKPLVENKTGVKQNAPTKGKNTSSETKPKTQRKDTESSVDFDKHFALSDESDSDWSDWDCEQMPLLNCLFCSHKEIEFSSLKSHMLKKHHVDFDAAVKDLNFYQKIKVVNYVRRQVCIQRCVTCNKRSESVQELLDHMSAEQHFGVGTRKHWDKPEYFFPTYEDDGLLCVLDDNPSDDIDDSLVQIISEDTMAKINKDAERLSLENFQYL